jgi:uncharacterized protein (UPF0332 family)
MSLSSDLLAQALKLAQADPQKPKQASLRRSVSASYYALFHFLIDDVVHVTIGSAPDLRLARCCIGRTMQHTGMKDYCKSVMKDLSDNKLLSKHWTGVAAAVKLDAKNTAESSVDLQEKRHSADYDLTCKFTRHEAKDAHDLSNEAIKAWKRVKAADAATHHLLCLGMLLCKLSFR